LGCQEALYFPTTHPSSLVSWQHLHADIYAKAIGPGFCDYAFTVVRNPYSRIASEYKMKGGDAGGRRSFDDWFAKLTARFAESPYVRDNHLRPQSDFLSPNLEIFRFEDGLEAPLRAACKVLGTHPPDTMPHARRGSDSLIECTPDSLRAVAEFYRQDFETLGYRPDRYEESFALRSP
jgi:hypothetical protein